MRLKIKLYNKNSSLFRKYLIVSLVIVIVSFLILGLILMTALTNYWRNTKHETMTKNVQTVASVCSDYILSNNNDYLIPDKVQFERVLDSLSANSGDELFLVNLNGRISATNISAVYAKDGEFIDYEFIKSALSSNSVFNETDLSGLYDEPRNVVACPVYLDNKVVAIAFVAYDNSEFYSFYNLMLNLFLLSAIVALGLAVFAIGVFSYNMTKPLRKIAYAAHQFGRGDFSTRVEVKSKDEIGQLAKEFNNMAESLSSSESTRRNFIANVSHELKTPMTTIAGFIDGILDGTVPPEKQDYYLKIVSGEVRRLSRLVRSMLDLSKIDSGELKLNYQRFDLSATLINTIFTFENELEKKNIDVRGLDAVGGTYIQGDPDLIHQVVYNLVENAVKFVNEGGYIEFKIIDSDTRVEFVITNSGPGIGKADIGMVFERFYKTDKSRSIDKKGMGLGLYLVKKIIRLHDGDITVESEVSKYCTFRFYIPKKPEKLPQSSELHNTHMLGE